MRRIAAAAKIEAGSIYYHFASRDQILRAVLERGVGNASEEVLAAIAEVGADSSPLVRLRAALGAHLKYTLRHHFSSRLKSIRRLPKRLRDHHMQQERDYAAIFADLLDEAGRKGLLQIRLRSLGRAHARHGRADLGRRMVRPRRRHDAGRHRRRTDARADERDRQIAS